MLAVFVTLTALVGTFALLAAALVYIVGSLVDRRPRPLHVPAAMACGFITGVLLIWSLVPSDWPLPFWTTLAATVSAAKYGHPVEHAAEGFVTWMLFAAVISSVASGFAARKLGAFLRRRHAS